MSLFSRSLTVAREALAAEKRETKVDRQGAELEFLPAAVEVLETPASPLPRVIAGLIVLFFLVAIVWAFFGHIDTVAVAEGKIIPGGRTKVIQPLEIGVVRAIHVRDGQAVKAGDILIEFDPTETEADKNQMAHTLMTSSLAAARLSGTLAALDDSKAAFEAPPGAPAELALLHAEKMRRDLAAHEATVGALKDERERRRAERLSVVSERSKLRQTVPLLRDQEESLAELLEKGFTPKSRWAAIKQALVEAEHDLGATPHRLAEIDAAIVSAEKQLAAEEATFRKSLIEQLVEARETMENARLALSKTDMRDQLRRLFAPVDGVVQQLQVHTVGGVVNPAQAVMAIVPNDASLEIEAFVQNKDVGFVSAGQQAEIKVESFQFTKYGLIEGEVLRVSADAIQDEERGLVYEARVELKETQIAVGGRMVNLTPGMAVTVEVKTGARRVIEFFLSPLLRYRQEALRER